MYHTNYNILHHFIIFIIYGIYVFIYFDFIRLICHEKLDMHIKCPPCTSIIIVCITMMGRGRGQNFLKERGWSKE